MTSRAQAANSPLYPRVRPFARLRRTSNDADYPRLDTPQLTEEDLAEDLPKAADIVAATRRLIPHLQPW